MGPWLVLGTNWNMVKLSMVTNHFQGLIVDNTLQDESLTFDKNVPWLSLLISTMDDKKFQRWYSRVAFTHPRSLKGLFNNGVDSSMMVDKNRLRRTCDLHSLLIAASALSQAHVVPLKSCLEIKRAKNLAPPPPTHKLKKYTSSPSLTKLDEPVSGRLQRLRESRGEVSEGELEGEESGGEEEPGWQFFFT